MIGQPEDSEGHDDEEDEEAALYTPVKHGAAQAADDGAVAEDDEGEGDQETQQRLHQVLEEFMVRAVPVVGKTDINGNVLHQERLHIAVGKERWKKKKKKCWGPVVLWQKI